MRPGERRARLRHVLGAVAHARHENAQHHQIAGEPQHDRQREPGIGRREQNERAGAVDQDVPDGGKQRDQRLADRRSGLHHAGGDAAGEVVLEECPGLAHHIPVVLPADTVRDIGRYRLIGHEVLRGERERPQHQQHQCHAEQVRPEFLEQLVRLVRRDERHDAADEHRNHGVEQRDHETGSEQAKQQAARLPGEMPIERHQPGRRLGLSGRGSRFQRPLEYGKHRTGLFKADTAAWRRPAAPPAARPHRNRMRRANGDFVSRSWQCALGSQRRSIIFPDAAIHDADRRNHRSGLARRNAVAKLARSLAPRSETAR